MMKEQGLKIEKYWLPVVGTIILLMTLAALFVIWRNVQDMEKTRYQELVDFTKNISETSEVFINNKQYEDFYKIIKLLTHIAYLRYIAVFLDNSKVLQAGDHNQINLALLDEMVKNSQKTVLDNHLHSLYVNQPLNYHQEKKANVLATFSLEDFQNSKRNIVYVTLVIFLLLIFLGICMFWLFEIYAALERSENTKSHMIRAISHDSMHTLSAIYSTLFSLLDQKKGRLPPQQLQKDLKQVRENVHGIKRVLENLRDNERMHQGNINIHREKIDLIYWIRFVVENFEMTLSQNELEIRLKLPSLPIYVWADKESLKSVLMNLIDNAVKYSDKGRLITIRVESKSPLVRVFIQDQGFGLPREAWEKIFLPFVRLENANKKIEGSGLGLSNARRQIRMHGGELKIAASQVGKGTTLVLELPMVEPRGQALDEGRKK